MMDDHHPPYPDWPPPALTPNNASPRLLTALSLPATDSATNRIPTGVTDERPSNMPPPAYRVPLPSRLPAIRPTHQLLHHTLERLADTRGQLRAVQSSLHQERGLLTSRKAQLLRHQHQRHAAHHRLESMRSAKIKRAVRYLGGGATTWRNAYAHAKATAQHEDDELQRLNLEVQRLIGHIAELEAEERSLNVDLEELTLAEEQLDALDEDLFGGPTPEYPVEDALELRWQTHASTKPLLVNSLKRESECTTHLRDASRHCSQLLHHLQTALQANIRSGLASNRKHVQQLFSEGGVRSTNKNTRRDVMRAKSELGDMYTKHAMARGKRECVKPLGEVQLIRLEQAPGNRGGVSEQAYHASLQRSYAQTRAVQLQLRTLVASSQRRCECGRAKLRELDATTEEAARRLRAYRRSVVRGEVAPASTEHEERGGDASWQAEGRGRGQGLDGVGDGRAVPTLSAGTQPPQLPPTASPTPPQRTPASSAAGLLATTSTTPPPPPSHPTANTAAASLVVVVPTESEMRDEARRAASNLLRELLRECEEVASREVESYEYDAHEEIPYYGQS